MKTLLLIPLFACFVGAQVSVALNLNDIQTLNYALTLEHLEAAFYNQELPKYNRTAFNATNLPTTAYDYLQLVRGHENAHVATLTSVIGSLNGTAVQACTYKFNTTSLIDFLTIASSLESVGVGAYDGAVDRINSAGLKQAAATIATVEARHAAYLRDLLSQVPFPADRDTPLTPAQVVAQLPSFISSCPAGSEYSVINPLVLECQTARVYNLTVNPSGFSYNVSATVRDRLNNNDQVALQYALTLENLEDTFYEQGLAIFNESSFLAAGYNASVRTYLTLIGAHEAAHVTFLKSPINGAGNTPVGRCQYKFNFTSVADFLATARTLENVGVSAYNGAINTIYNPVLRVAAATIATVEGRHAAYLNEITGRAPFPDNSSVDAATAPATILSAVSQFVAFCNYTLVAPKVLDCNTGLEVGQSDTASTSATSATSTVSATSASGATTVTSPADENPASIVQFCLALLLCSVALFF